MTLADTGRVLSTSDATATGPGGEVVIDVTGHLAIAAGTGPSSVLTGISAQTEGAGPAGRVDVRAGTLTLSREGATISSGTRGGDAGEVAVEVRGALLIDGMGRTGFLTGITSQSEAGSTGRAGTVRIQAGSITIRGGGSVSSITAGTGDGGTVRVDTPGALVLDGLGAAGMGIAASAIGPQSGRAGTVVVRAGTVTIQGGAQIASSTAGAGQGGNVDVAAASDILLAGAGGGPQIATTSTGTGDAGSITVSAPRLTLRDGAGISTEALGANGGNITILASDMVYLLRGSITTSVNGALGNGGNILIDPRFVVLDSSVIQANAVGGNGGNILIRADQFVQSADSAITATSERSLPGEIAITATPLNLNGSLVVLASDLRAAAALLSESCAVRGARPGSSLVVAGRGGLRQDPEVALSALYIADRPVRAEGAGGAPQGAAAADAPARHTGITLSGRC